MPGPGLELDPQFIEKVSNKVTEHKKRRLLSSSSSDENDVESQFMRALVSEVVTKAMEGLSSSIQSLILKQDEQIKK